jgi:hypothetical protein
MKTTLLRGLIGALAALPFRRTRLNTSINIRKTEEPPAARPIHTPVFTDPLLGRTLIGNTLNGSRRASDRRSYLADRRIARRRRNLEKRRGGR